MEKNKESKFLRVLCPRCKNAQMVFGKSTIKIKCKKCSLLLTKTTGGKARIMAKVQQIL